MKAIVCIGYREEETQASGDTWIGRNFRFEIVIIIFDVKCIWPWKCVVLHWCSTVTDAITILNETTMQHAGGIESNALLHTRSSWLNGFNIIVGMPCRRNNDCERPKMRSTSFESHSTNNQIFTIVQSGWNVSMMEPIKRSIDWLIVYVLKWKNFFGRIKTDFDLIFSFFSHRTSSMAVHRAIDL